MSNANPYVSNGTCYTAQGKKLGDDFVPCGNDAFGHQTCCGAGDNCLADNACFGVHGSGYGSYLTYWAGCTDPDYEAGTCPQKVIDQPWVALTRCDDVPEEWAVCSQEGNPSSLQPGSFCSCTVAASATVAFSDASTLTSICSLPKDTGQSIQFFVGHFPSSNLVSPSASSPSQNSPSASSPSQTAASTGAGTSDGSSAASSSQTGTSGPASTESSSTSVTVFTSSSVTVFTSDGSTLSSTATLTATSAAVVGGASSGGTHSGLASGAKIGIGVGAGLGVLAVLALILFLILRRRKRRRPARSPVESGEYFVDGGAKLSKRPLSDQPSMSQKPTTPPMPLFDKEGQIISEADGRAANPWALRNELEGSHVPRRGELGPIAELPGSENFAGEQGAQPTLAQEANRQIGSGWKGPSFRLLNSGAGKEYLQSASGPGKEYSQSSSSGLGKEYMHSSSGAGKESLQSSSSQYSQ